MDKIKYVVYIELFRSILALIILYKFEDWFGLTVYLSYDNYLIAGYYISCIFGAIYFTYFDKTKTQKTGVYI